MLVFQENIDHVRKRCEDPTRCGRSFDWLLDIVAEINLWLPDDWRLTRSGSNFRIQVIAEGVTFALVGRSHRTSNEQIIHVCNTVFARHYYDPFDLQEITGGRPCRIDREFLRRHPEIITPNLYYFRPAPTGFNSPLFARQYEKITKNPNDPYQYHRIHPLTREGLDPAHPLWVRWKLDGEVTIRQPQTGYHGPDYWRVGSLSQARGPGGGRDLEKGLAELLTAAGIDPRQRQDDEPRKRIRELKFLLLPEGRPDVGDNHRGRITELLTDHGWQPETHWEGSGGGNSRDIYFDDEHNTLLAAGLSLRLRRKNGLAYLGLKQNQPETGPGHSPAPTSIRRLQEELFLTREQETMVAEGNLPPSPIRRLLEALAPNRGRLQPVLEVELNRHRYLLKTGRPGYSAVLDLDRVGYRAAGREFGNGIEIEIKNIIEEDEIIVDETTADLRTALPLLPTRRSKFARGRGRMRTDRRRVSQPPRKVIIDTDCGVDDALALLLALTAPELEVLAITTVSGNVHIDKVIPNVFKVFTALELKNPPPVARGAAEPLAGGETAVESVHGKDGLGDAFPTPENTPLISTPAAELICDLARRHPGEITLVTIGPLTNLAQAIRRDPEAVARLAGVVSMGGVFFASGNIAPDAEFNVFSDPEAAAEVVEFHRRGLMSETERGVPLTFVGLDVTHRVVLDRALLERLADDRPDHARLAFARAITRKYMDFYFGNEGLPGCYLHDPLAVAWVINPAFLEIEKQIVRVETRGDFTRGMIFPDDRPTRNREWRNPDEAVIGVARRVEAEAFEEFFIGRLAAPY